MQQLLGLGLFALNAVGWLVLNGVDGGIVMLVVSSSVCMIGGIGIFGRGTLQVGRATKHLHTVNAMKQLPVARVRELKP